MKRQRGLTLIELILFIVIVSVGVVGILTVLNVTVRNSADPAARKQALAIAEAMMDEILAKDFSNPAGGFSPGTAGRPTQVERQSFDDVGDYDMLAGWSWDVRSIGDVSTAVAGLGNFTIFITVEASGDLSGIATSDARKVTVQVSSGANNTISLVGYRTRYE